MSPEYLCDEIMRSQYAWHASIAYEYAAIPRAFSGIRADGKRFIAQLAGLSLNHVERHQFIKFALERERSVAFAYGSLMLSQGAGDVEPREELTFSAGTAHNYHWVNCALNRTIEPGRIILNQISHFQGKNPGEVIGAWFLTSELEVPPYAVERFTAMWKSMESSIERF